MANVINWFEIPVTDFDRAKNFYSEVMDGDMHITTCLGVKMGFFPMQGDGVGGAICEGENYKPSSDGAKVYLSGGEDLSAPLARVEKAGGKVVMPKTKISDEVGYMAFFVDTEGNNVAFHSPK